MLKKMFTLLTFAAATFIGGQLLAQKQITIQNKSGALLYVYDVHYNPPPVALKKQTTIDNGKSYVMSLTDNSEGMRIYIAPQPLDCLTASPATPPDEFNPSVGGNIPFNFIEYATNRGGANIIDCVDLSFLDSVSFPCEITVNNTTWGLKSFDKVIAALKTATTSTAPWDSLVYFSTPANGKPLFRLFGPNKGMVAPPTVPAVYKFAQAFPPSGNNLTPGYSNAAWQTATDLSACVFCKAYHDNSSAQPYPGKKGNIYGYFLYPQDNTNGQLDNIPVTSKITVTIYPMPTAANTTNDKGLNL